MVRAQSLYPFIIIILASQSIHIWIFLYSRGRVVEPSLRSQLEVSDKPDRSLL